MSLSPILPSSIATPPPLPYTSSSSSGSKITPAILFIIIILAVVFFVSGLLHLFVRFLVRHRSSSISESNRYPEVPGSDDIIQRQLQQLFNLHDSGLSQAFIDALPVFVYKEIRGLKEPFDCAVCLCEFLEHDKLRLLPMCSHAFHLDCIDTWLLSNSTCPLCRGTLFAPGFAFENPVFDFEDQREEVGFLGSGEGVVDSGQKPAENEFLGGRRMFPVRLGKYKSSTNGNGVGSMVGETSNSNLDARRCYSMGSYQYVVANSELQVALCPNRNGAGGENSTMKVVKGKNWNSSIDGDAAEGKRIINTSSKGESFSVSKIWLWSKKDKFTGSSETNMSNYSVNTGLPWTDRNQYT